MCVSVELGIIIPRYQANRGTGAPVAWHCRVVDWPTASNTSRYGPNVIVGASASAYITRTHIIPTMCAGGAKVQTLDIANN